MVGKNISELDRNLCVDTIDDSGLVFHDVRADPFDLYGLYDAKNQCAFRRIPQELAAQIGGEIAVLSEYTAGGRVRFTTDSDQVAIRAKMPSITRFSHMTLAGSSGFDLYIDQGGKSCYHGTFMPPVDMQDGYQQLIKFPSREVRHITINFPLYNQVDTLYIGLLPGAFLDHGAAYRVNKPVLYYGSSITQGGCASRPGNSYQAIISRRLDCDHINLGFSGNARGEAAIAEYIAAQDISVFVFDYDYNAVTYEDLRATHEPFFQIVRRAQPRLPIIMMPKPNPEYGDIEQKNLRRYTIFETYAHAQRAGDENVYFIDAVELFGDADRDSCTVDSTHPNDFGFLRMAAAIGRVVAKCL